MIVERTAMKPQLFAPFVTYPQASDPAIAVKAVMIAAELHGDLHAVAFNADIPDISNVWSNLLLDLPDMIGKAEEDSRQHGEQLLRKVVEAAEKNKVTITTERHKGAIALLGGLAAEQARYFDLVILGWENGNPTSRATAEAVLFGSGRPTLLIPHLFEPKGFQRVAVAWDGSVVAARAVACAMPLLQQASQIHVLTVTDEKPMKEKEAGERLAHGLRRRGFLAVASTILAADRRIAVTLQDHAVGLHADVLVMGGYGHSRLREFVLGGATQGILDDLRLPVFISH